MMMANAGKSNISADEVESDDEWEKQASAKPKKKNDKAKEKMSAFKA